MRDPLARPSIPVNVSPTRRVVDAAALILVTCVALAVAGRNYLSDVAFLSVGIAVASFLLSAIAAFKAEIFGAVPGVSGGDIIWLQTVPYASNPILALPLFLRNDGYGDAILQWLAITVQGPDWPKAVPFETVVEVNMAKVIEQAGRYDKNAYGPPVTRLFLPSKHVTFKTIQFTPSLNSHEGPLVWNPGTYHFCVFMKLEGQAKRLPALAFSFTHSPESLVDYAAGRTFIFPNTGYKREFIAPEWGPQSPEGGLTKLRHS